MTFDQRFDGQFSRETVRPMPSPVAGNVLRWGRVLALFFGGFSLLNLAGEFLRRRFDASIWWIDLRPLPEALGRAILLAAAVLFVAFAVAPAIGPRRRLLTQVLAWALFVAAMLNAIQYYLLAAYGVIRAGVPVPLSLLVALALVMIVLAIWRATTSEVLPRLKVLRALLFFAVLCVLFPLAQMFLFGTTDYRRKADAIVVFGAGVHPDGTCTLALTDRVTTACTLWSEGYAPRIILSGGPGQGAVHETEGMRRLASSLGVPDGAILLDARGVNTEATVRSTVAMLDGLGATRVLVVSHFYHLPRVKMTYYRHGLDVYTVPARESRILKEMPWYVAREVVALWVYYLRPLGAPEEVPAPKAPVTV